MSDVIFELNGSPGLLLDDHRSSSYRWAGDKGSNLHFHEVATAKLAVDCAIKQSSIAHPAFAIQEKSDQPDLLHFQRSFDADLFANVPRRSTSRGRVVL